MAGYTTSQLRQLAVQAANAAGIDPNIFLRQINQESGFNPGAHSSAGAEGIAQFMPSTAAGMGVNPMDPKSALFGAARMDAGNINKYGGWAAALSAYNSGRADAYKDPSFANGQTYNYVRDILGPTNAAWGEGGRIKPGKPGQGQSGLPPLTPKPGNGLGQLGKFMALNLLTQAGNSVNGGSSNPSNLLTMAMLRNQFNAANQQFGQPIHIPDNSNQAPNVHGGWAGKSLDGSIPMVLGGKSPYSNLKFDGNVDWQHINPRLLRSVNSVAANHGTVVTINSGYRSNNYSHSVGGFVGDPHTKGLAIDAFVGGKPIGDVFGPNVWKNLGITSGAVPNFYNGNSDPEHLQL